jgi:hypothetical protein
MTGISAKAVSALAISSTTRIRSRTALLLLKISWSVEIERGGMIAKRIAFLEDFCSVHWN